jgi:hypothetical protein
MYNVYVKYADLLCNLHLNIFFKRIFINERVHTSWKIKYGSCMYIVYIQAFDPKAYYIFFLVLVQIKQISLFHDVQIIH